MNNANKIKQKNIKKDYKKKTHKKSKNWNAIVQVSFSYKYMTYRMISEFIHCEL